MSTSRDEAGRFEDEPYPQGFTVDGRLYNGPATTGEGKTPFPGGIVIGDPKSRAFQETMELMRRSRERYPGAQVTTMEEALAITRAAVEWTGVFPEKVEVHDPVTFGRRLVSRPRLSSGGWADFSITEAAQSKLGYIRLRVREELKQRDLLAGIPDLLLVAGDAVTSIWDDKVRQAVDD